MRRDLLCEVQRYRERVELRAICSPANQEQGAPKHVDRYVNSMSDPKSTPRKITSAAGTREPLDNLDRLFRCNAESQLATIL